LTQQHALPHSTVADDRQSLPFSSGFFVSLLLSQRPRKCGKAGYGWKVVCGKRPAIWCEYPIHYDAAYYLPDPVPKLPSVPLCKT
jgi:hypothetical protein